MHDFQLDNHVHVSCQFVGLHAMFGISWNEKMKYISNTSLQLEPTDTFVYKIAVDDTSQINAHRDQGCSCYSSCSKPFSAFRQTPHRYHYHQCRHIPHRNHIMYYCAWNS